MRVITWNKSFRGISNGEGGKDEVDLEESETLANVLDKMLAWEKKLYEEVKVHCVYSFLLVCQCYFVNRPLAVNVLIVFYKNLEMEILVPILD